MRVKYGINYLPQLLTLFYRKYEHVEMTQTKPHHAAILTNNAFSQKTPMSKSWLSLAMLIFVSHGPNNG